MPHFSGLPRRKIRYWCFRLQTEATEGTPSDGVPDGLKDYYEAQLLFDGWARFGKSWDLEEEDPLQIKRRQFTIHEEWNATLRRVVPVVPGLEHMEKSVEDGSESDV